MCQTADALDIWQRLFYYKTLRIASSLPFTHENKVYISAIHLSGQVRSDNIKETSVLPEYRLQLLLIKSSVHTRGGSTS